jgi:HK97 family phage portal protein
LGGGTLRNPFKSKASEAKSFDVLPEGLWEQWIASSDMGATIGLEQAVGLPAVLAVIRFISHAVGLIPFNVVRDVDPSSQVAERAIETWQWSLLNRRPGPPPMTPFNFKADLAANFCGRGNAYVRKLKPTTYSPRLTRDTPRVTELLPLHAGSVKPTRATSGAVVFSDSTGQTPVDRGTDEIIQIRSFAVAKDGLTGISPITACRTFVSAGLKRNQFEDRHLTNGIAPGAAIGFPRGMTEEQAGRWLDMIEQKHKGSAKVGKLLGLPDGSTFTSLPISLADALFADMTRLTIEQACALYQVPLAIYSGTARRPVTDDDFRHFNAFAIGPVLTAMTQAFEADDDLFALPADNGLRVKPDASALLEMDPLKKAQVQREQVQTGTRLVDELRGQDGYGPLPPVPDDWSQAPGMVPQITPVGGAPNPEVSTGDDPAAADTAP